MSIFGDAVDWIGGAAESAWDWAGDAWDSVTGQSDFVATPYTSDLSAAYAPLEQMAARQEQTASAYNPVFGAYAQGMMQSGERGANQLSALAQASQDVGARSAARQWGTGDAMAGIGAGYGNQFQGLGAQANTLGSQSAAQLGGIGSNLASTGANFGGQQSALASSMMAGPSVAALQGNAAQARAEQEIAARIAGARGANSALMQRDAVQSGQMARANLANDLAAAAAAESVQRHQAASGMLGAASQAALTGQQGQLAAAQAAAQAAMQGNAQAGQQLQQGFGAAMAGQQGRLAATQGGTQAELAGLGQSAQATQAAGAERMAGYRGGLDATQAAAQTTMAGQQAAAGTLGAAAQARTAEQQINAGSHDSTNATNAGVQNNNATNTQQTVGGLVKGAAMLSDVRNKENIELLDPVVNPYHAKRQKPVDPKTGNSWEDASSMFAQMLKGSGSDTGSSELDVMMSDKKTKANEQRLDTPEGNRANLSKVHPYSYSYKPDVASRIGEDTAPRVGVMAQDIEESPAGQNVVVPTEEGKGLDVNRGLGYALAAAAGLDKRVAALEGNDPKDLGGVDESILAAATRGAEVKPPSKPKDRVDEYDEMWARARPIPEPHSPVVTAGRAALQSAADTAAAPVVLAGRALRAAGIPNAAAKLSGAGLISDLDYLTSGMSPEESRAQRIRDAEVNPTAASVGHIAGTAAGTAPASALFRRAGMTALQRAAGEGAAASPAATQMRADIAGRAATDRDLVLDALKSAVGAAASAGYTGAMMARAPKTPYYTVDSRGQEVAQRVFGKPVDQKTAYKILGTHPDLEDGSYYLTHDPLDDAMRLELSTKSGASVQVSFRGGSEGAPARATLDLFSLPKEMQGKGIATNVLKQQVENLDKHGIPTLDLTAVSAGKAVWPKLGFELKNPGQFTAIRAKFDEWLKGAGVDPSTVKADNLRDIASYVDPSRPGLMGRDFLASKFSGGPLELVADLRGPSGDALRSAIGAKSPRAARGKTKSQSSSSNALSRDTEKVYHGDSPKP